MRDQVNYPPLEHVEVKKSYLSSCRLIIVDKGSVPEGHYALFVSMVELYNEKCYDLFARQIGRQECKIRQDASGFYTDGCRQVRANSLDEALRIIEAGRQNLTVAATRYNQVASLLIPLSVD